MTKEQEARLKYLMLSSNIKLDKEDFEFKKDVLKKTIPMFPMIMNEPIPDTNYIDELDYETYLKWVEEHIEFINERYYDLNDRINSVVKLYFDKEDVSYTAKEVKKILSDTDIYNAEKGFGGIKDD